jgi:hypothetical protein
MCFARFRLAAVQDCRQARIQLSTEALLKLLGDDKQPPTSEHFSELVRLSPKADIVQAVRPSGLRQIGGAGYLGVLRCPPSAKYLAPSAVQG